MGTKGGTLIFSYIRRLGPLFWVQNFELIFWGFIEKRIFFEYEGCVDIFWGHHKIGLCLGVILCILGSTELGKFLGVAKIAIFFFGCLKFLIFFLVNGRC